MQHSPYPDGNLVYDSDIRPNEPGDCVECEWGYEGCSGADYSAFMMTYEDGYMCYGCYSTAQAEYDEYLDVRRYG